MADLKPSNLTTYYVHKHISENFKLDGFNIRSEAAKDRIGELCNGSEEIILRTTQRNKKKEDWKHKILREDLTCLIGVPE